MKKTLLIPLMLLLLSFSSYGETRANKVAIGTNGIGWLNLGTANMDIGVSVHRYWSVHLSGKYNPYYWNISGHSFQNKQITASAGVRYWPWYVFSGWHYEAALQYSQYNRGGILSPKTEEGDAYGLSLYGGYALMLNKWLNLEFGLGAWAGLTHYKTYASPRCGKLIEKGNKFFILPNDINVSVTFTF